MAYTNLRQLAATLLLGSALAVPAAAQGAAKQQTLEPHIQNQLWPSRSLSATEQEFKDRVIAMRDTVIALQATVEQADRARRNRNTPAVLTSLTRAVGGSCARVGRNSEGLKGFAADLRSNDTRFGEPAIVRFRNAIDSVHRAMGNCENDSGKLVGSAATTGAVDPDQTLKLLDGVRTALAHYLQAAEGLAKTLNIRIDATEKS